MFPSSYELLQKMTHKQAKEVIAKKLATGEYVRGTKHKEGSIWTIFATIKDKNGEELKGFYQCRVCEQVYICMKFSRSHFTKHKCYMEEYPKLLNLENFGNLTLDEILNVDLHESEKSSDSNHPITNVESQSVEVKNIDHSNTNHLLKLITNFVINDCKSLNMIQDPGILKVFQEIAHLGSTFGNSLDMDKFLPSPKTISRNIAKIYVQYFEKVKMEIATIKDIGFGLTTDIWTDSHTKLNYIALNIHYTRNAELSVRLLAFRLLEDTTTKNIESTIKAILSEFNCKLSKSIIVTNNDCNVMQALPNIKKLPCITLLITNVLQQSINEVNEVAELTTAYVKLTKCFKESSPNDKFVNSLPTYTPNSWYSIYKILHFIEHNWSKINETLEAQNENQLLAALNINYVKAMNKALVPFKEVLESLGEYHEVNFHLVLIYLHGLIKSCNTDDNEFRDFDFIENFKSNVRTNLMKLFCENITILHKVALFLYPPTNKLLLFTDYQKTCIEEACIHLCMENELNPVHLVPVPQLTTCTKTHNELFLDFVDAAPHLEPIALINQELQCYKNMNVKNCEDFDCLGWWQSHRHAFPILYHLSCSIFAVPANTALIQHIFSVAGRFLGEISDSGSNETDVEKIMFIKFNEK